MDRAAVSASLAFVSAKYDGRAPVSADDDGSWHGALQDFRLGVRYQVVTAPVAVTPSVGFAFPVSDYETGFAFAHPTVEGLRWALNRAVDTYRNRPDHWTSIQRNAMERDWSWKRSAGDYLELYRRLHGRGAGA